MLQGAGRQEHRGNAPALLRIGPAARGRHTLLPPATLRQHCRGASRTSRQLQATRLGCWRVNIGSKGQALLWWPQSRDTMPAAVVDCADNWRKPGKLGATIDHPAGRSLATTLCALCQCWRGTMGALGGFSGDLSGRAPAKPPRQHAETGRCPCDALPRGAADAPCWLRPFSRSAWGGAGREGATTHVWLAR
jgi:hypothetical protein